MEKAIVDGLLRILFMLRIGSVIGLLAMFVFTPMPWKLFVMAPFVIPPIWYFVERTALRLRPTEAATGPTPAEAGELKRMQAIVDRRGALPI